MSGKVFAFATADGMIAGLRYRRQILGLSQVVADDLAGLKRGRTKMLEGSIGGGGRSIDWPTVTALLRALGLRFDLVEVHRAAPHQNTAAIAGHWAKIGQKGGRIRAVRMTSDQKRAAARHAARARWARRSPRVAPQGGAAAGAP